MADAIKAFIAKRDRKKKLSNEKRDAKLIIGYLGPNNSAKPKEGDADDTGTISSFSTTATADNNPGAGMTVDKYFYQPMGRRVEKLAMRISMPILSPGRIFRYIEERVYYGSLVFSEAHGDEPTYLELAPIYLSGLSSLVRQTQSDSLIRSAVALSALSRLCPTDDLLEDFYYYAHKSISVLNLAALSNDYESREEKCYRLLVKLAWARPGFWFRNPEYLHLTAGRPGKKVLIVLIQSWKGDKKDPFEVISEALHLFTAVAEHATCVKSTKSYENLYFYLLFVMRFIPFFLDEPTRQRTDQLNQMLLSTFLRWLDSALYTFFAFPDSEPQPDTPDILERRLAIYGLLVCEARLKLLLPATWEYLHKHEIYEVELLPRRLRSGTSLWKDIMLRVSISRTLRLVNSIDELEYEVAYILNGYKVPESKMDCASVHTSDEEEEELISVHDNKEENRINVEKSLSQARCVQVARTDTTEEFLRARREKWGWRYYKERCQMRHMWGIYFLSALDWDSETTSCLERLFELPEEPAMSSAPIATVNLDAGSADTWNVYTEARLPKLMRVAYTSRSGETKYKTFMPCPSSEDVDVVSASELESKQVDEEQGGAFQGNPGPPIFGGCRCRICERASIEAGRRGTRRGFSGQRYPGPPIAGRVSLDIRILSTQSCHGESKEIEDASADVSGQMSGVPVAIAPTTNPKEKNNGLGDTCAGEDSLEGTREDLELKQKQLVPRISIDSLD